MSGTDADEADQPADDKVSDTSAGCGRRPGGRGRRARSRRRLGSEGPAADRQGDPARRRRPRRRGGRRGLAEGGALRRAGRPAHGARAWGRPGEGEGERAQGPDPQGRRSKGRRTARSGGGRCRYPGPRPRPLAEGELREVRRGRARSALARQEDLGARARAELGDDPARHARRRVGHHRPRGVSQGGERRAEGREGDDGRPARQGLRRRASPVPRRSTPRSTATSW